jgi:hypothetical protein
MARDRARTLRTLRYLAALFLIGTGVLHLEQFFAVYYRVIPVIGPLFAANFAIGVVLGLVLLAPMERLGRWVPPLIALGGIAFAAGTIIGLELSETGTLFGFHEHGYRAAVILSIALEGAAIGTLCLYLLARRGGSSASDAAI